MFFGRPLSLSPFIVLPPPPRVWNNDIYLLHHINSRVTYAHHKQPGMSAPPPVKGKKVIVIIGAGLSSVALVKALRRGDSTISKIIILEAKDDIGGTWNPKQCYHNLQTHGVRAGFSLLPWDRFDSPYDHAHHKDVHGAMKNLFRKENVVVVEGAQHQNFGRSNGNEEEKEKKKKKATRRKI